MKCTGINCPMQVGYPVDQCESQDCPYRTEPLTIADHIRAMTDEELAWCLARMLATYTAELYDGRYVPSDEAVCEIKDNLLRQLQSPAESPTGQKG